LHPDPATPVRRDGASWAGEWEDDRPQTRTPLEGQTSTRIDSDVTHSLVPSSPPRRSGVRADRAVRRYAAFQGGPSPMWCCTAISCAPAPVGSPHRRDLRATRRYGGGDREVPLSASRPEREGRPGDPAERDPAGGTRCGWSGGGDDAAGCATRGEQCGGPEHPLEGQTSTRIGSDAMHSLVPPSPPRRSDDPTGGPSGSPVRGFPGGCIAEVVLYFDLSRSHLLAATLRGEMDPRFGNAH